MAILVNSTNLASADWVPFNANPTVNLGTGDGLKTVNFYFNSLSNLVSCYSFRLWLDTTPPAITITSPGPGTNTVNQPLLQLQGYAPEELSSVTYDITNSAGWLTNQPAVVLSRYYDTNLGQFTTNTFQAFDLDLTVGANQITLHAKDLAGNVTTSNLTYTLDYSSKTNPPVLALYWPTNGALICGTNFTWRGSVDDPTVTISAQIVDTNGDTNVVNGIVERNGNFWVENLPLASGTNWLTLTATDAVRQYECRPTSRLSQSLVNLTFTSVPDITNQTTITRARDDQYDWLHRLGQRGAGDERRERAAGLPTTCRSTERAPPSSEALAIPAYGQWRQRDEQRRRRHQFHPAKSGQSRSHRTMRGLRERAGSKAGHDLHKVHCDYLHRKRCPAAGECRRSDHNRQLHGRVLGFPIRRISE